MKSDMAAALSSAKGTSCAELISAERVAGLWPRTWVAVGAGFQREEIKGVVLAHGFALSATAVSSLAEIAARVVGVGGRDRVLGAAARQEALRGLVGERRIRSIWASSSG